MSFRMHFRLKQWLVLTRYRLDEISSSLSYDINNVPASAENMYKVHTASKSTFITLVKCEFHMLPPSSFRGIGQVDQPSYSRLPTHNRFIQLAQERISSPSCSCASASYSLEDSSRPFPDFIGQEFHYRSQQVFIRIPCCLTYDSSIYIYIYILHSEWRYRQHEDALNVRRDIN